MRKTIAEFRKKQVYRLAALDTKNNASVAIADATKLMNSFYRLCGLEEKLLYLENEEKTCNSKYTANLEVKAEKWRERLQSAFNAYGLMLVWYGYLPTITDHKGGNEIIYTYFYND